MTKFLNDTGLGTLISLIKGEINDKKSIYIGTSPSGDASKYQKTATVDTFPLTNGAPKVGTIVAVKYLASNTYKTAGHTYTLNVNSTGAYPMYYNNAELATSTSANTLVAGYKNRYCYYIFNGTQWVWLGAGYDTNSTYSAMTQAEITAGTGTTGRTLTPALLRSNFYTEGEVDAKLPLVVNFTESNDVWTCDTSIADIYAAYSADRVVVANANNEGQMCLGLCSEGFALFNYLFSGSAIYLIGSTSDNTDTWILQNVALQEALIFDNTPTASSTNPVTSGGVYTALQGKQDKDFVVNLTYSNDTFTADKTYAEILAAHNAGKNIVVWFEDLRYIVQYFESSNDGFYFTVTEGDNYNVKILILNTENVWSYTPYEYQGRLTFDNTPTANSDNPVKSSGIKTALDAKQDKGFIITLSLNNGVYTANKSYSEVLAAYNAGKTPVVLYGEYVCNFVSYDGSDFHFINHPYDELSVLYQATLRSNNTWEYYGLGLQEELIFDNTPTANSTKPVTSSGIKSALDGKQDTLVSGTSIKTVNNNSLLGSGDVQVGDITGEELEAEIEEMEATLMTDALRKTAQILTVPEKTQVLANLGISDVAKESNLKTINGASIVGSGDIQVVSVDAGNINVLQTTGTSQTDVMSQKAVTDVINQHIEERGTSFFFEGHSANYLYSFPLTELQQSIISSAEILTFRFCYRGSSTRATFFRDIDNTFNITVGASNGTLSVNGVTVLGYNNTDGTVLSLVIDRIKGVVKVYKETVLLNTVTNNAFVMNSFPVSSYYYFVPYYFKSIFSFSVFDCDIFEGDVCTSYNRDAQGYTMLPAKMNTLNKYHDWQTASVFNGVHPAWTKTTDTDGTHFTISASSTATDKKLAFTQRPTYTSTGITKYFVTDYYFTVVSGTVSARETNASYSQRLYNATTGALITDMNSISQGSYILRTWGSGEVYSNGYAVLDWVSGDAEVVLTQFRYKPVVCVVDIKGDVISGNEVYDTASGEMKKFYYQSNATSSKTQRTLVIQNIPLRYIVYNNSNYAQAFMGQMKIYDGKIYIADASYTWKQINNS